MMRIVRLGSFARSGLRFGPALLTASVLTLTGFPAHAGDTALAEALFREGQALMKQERYAEACPKFAESFRQEEAAGTLLSLALCHERSGKTATAWAIYSDVVTRSRRDNRSERERFAREQRAALEQRLSRLTIRVAPAATRTPGLVVLRDGAEVGEPAWNSASPIDPGEHVVEARAPGKKAWSRKVQVGAKADSQSVEVPALEDLPLQAEPVVSEHRQGPNAPLAPSERHAADPRGSSILPVVGLSVAAVGVASLGVSSYFGLRASSLNKASNRDGHCTADGCDDFGLVKRKDAISAATASTVTAIVGGALVAGGITMFVVGRSQSPHQVGVAPVFGPGLFAISVQGRVF